MRLHVSFAGAQHRHSLDGQRQFAQDALFRFSIGAEEDGARERAVVAVTDARDFEEGAFTFLERRVIPGEMRGGGVGANAF